MKTIKVLTLALIAAFAVTTVNAQTAPAKPAAKTEKPAAKKEEKKEEKAEKKAEKAEKKAHKKHEAKKPADKK